MEEVNKEKGFGIDVGGKGAQPIQQQERIEEQWNGGSVVAEARAFKAKYSELFENPEALPSTIRAIVLFISELIDEDKEEATEQ